LDDRDAAARVGRSVPVDPPCEKRRGEEDDGDSHGEPHGGDLADVLVVRRYEHERRQRDVVGRGVQPLRPVSVEDPGRPECGPDEEDGEQRE